MEQKKPGRPHQRRRTAAELLAEFDKLPDDCLVDPKVAADMLHTSEGALAIMRFQRRGPDFVNFGDRKRYRVGTLRKYIADNTVPCDDGQAA